jgi:hypothetical protein
VYGVLLSYCTGITLKLCWCRRYIDSFIRYVNLGGGNRPFASNDAKADDLLPMDEDSWDQGVRDGC